MFWPAGFTTVMFSTRSGIWLIGENAPQTTTIINYFRPELRQVLVLSFPINRTG